MIEVLVCLVTTVVGGILTFVLTKSKYNSEVLHNNILNMQSVVEYFKLNFEAVSKIAEETKVNYESVVKKLHKCEEELLNNRNEIIKLKELLVTMSRLVCLNFNCKERICNGVKTNKKVLK